MQHSGIPVLIVEDDAMLALDLEMILRDAGYEICAVASKNEKARQAIEKSPPAVALLDYNLRDATSAATANELSRRAIPFAYVTGRRSRFAPTPARRPRGSSRSPIRNRRFSTCSMRLSSRIPEEPAS